MDKTALLKLADHITTIPPKGFDMRGWLTLGTPGYGLQPNRTSKDLQKAYDNKFRCGMAACLGGHAAIVFPKRLAIDYGMLETVGEGRDYGEAAFARAFGLCKDHAIRLTLPPVAKHKTPKAAAKAIRALVAENPICCRRGKARARFWLYRQITMRKTPRSKLMTVWAVGYYQATASYGLWVTVSFYPIEAEAAARVHYLNGGGYPLVSEPPPRKGRGLPKTPSKTP